MAHKARDAWSNVVVLRTFKEAISNVQAVKTKITHLALLEAIEANWGLVEVEFDAQSMVQMLYLSGCTCLAYREA